MALRRQEDVKALDLSRRAIDIPNQGSKSRQCSFSDRLLETRAVTSPFAVQKVQKLNFWGGELWGA